MIQNFYCSVLRIFWIIVFAFLINTSSITDQLSPTVSLRATNVPRDLAELESFKDGKTAIVFAHQDDDLLWMLPFWPTANKFLLSAIPPFPAVQDLIQSFPYEMNYAKRWKPIWKVETADEFVATFIDKCLREKIIYLDSIKEHLRPHLQGDVRRVVTHNNWGEYGHHQHRLVNQAVRELAVEYKFDVYALGVLVHLDAFDRLEGYEDVADRTGLPQPIQGFFDMVLFHKVREKYLNRRPYGNTVDVTYKLQRWSSTLWTWSPQLYAFPEGWRSFLKLVKAGEDLTIGNDAVHQLSAEQPIVNACPERSPSGDENRNHSTVFDF